MNVFRYLLLTALVALPTFADTANTFIYNGTPTSTTHNEDVSASFIVSGGNLLVTLSNTTPNLIYDTQILTGVLFTYTGAGSITGTVTNPTTQGYNINDSNGQLTASGTPASANWHTEVGDLSGYVTLTNLNNSGNGGGSHGIISTSTNSGGTNNLSNHEVFLEGPLQFSIAGLGLTSSSQITSVEFNFGTATGTTTTVITSLTATPEPSGFLLLGIGLVGICWAGRNRSLKA
jgi:hypothetical protein